MSAPADTPSLAFKERKGQEKGLRSVYLFDQLSPASERTFKSLSCVFPEGPWLLALGPSLCTPGQNALTHPPQSGRRLRPNQVTQNDGRTAPHFHGDPAHP